MSLCACDTYSKILSSLTQVLIIRVSTHDTIGIRNDLSVLVARPSLKDDNFIKLLALCFVHIHDNHTKSRRNEK